MASAMVGSPMISCQRLAALSKKGDPLEAIAALVTVGLFLLPASGAHSSPVDGAQPVKSRSVGGFAHRCPKAARTYFGIQATISLIGVVLRP